MGTRPGRRRAAHHLALKHKLAHMALPLAPLVQVTTGRVHPRFPARVLSFWLLTDAELDSLANFYHQRKRSVWSRDYPCPISWHPRLSTAEKRRRIGKFIGLRGCESPAAFAAAQLLWRVIAFTEERGERGGKRERQMMRVEKMALPGGGGSGGGGGGRSDRGDRGDRGGGGGVGVGVASAIATPTSSDAGSMLTSTECDSQTLVMATPRPEAASDSVSEVSWWGQTEEEIEGRARRARDADDELRSKIGWRR